MYGHDIITRTCLGINLYKSFIIKFVEEKGSREKENTHELKNTVKISE